MGDITNRVKKAMRNSSKEEGLRVSKGVLSIIKQDGIRVERAQKMSEDYRKSTKYKRNKVESLGFICVKFVNGEVVRAWKDDRYWTKDEMTEYLSKAI
jgi:hypothetical protein